MKLKRLYIGSMGIFRNALLENLSPKIVVIGGKNRAGKTTFLETIRHMAYGFPKNLRDSVLEYNVEGDFVSDEGKEFYLVTNGLKEPVLRSAESNESLSFKEFYGNMDRFSYSQLYTITLDELKRSNVKAEEEKLQSVLLGAGLKEIVHIPKIVEEFRKDKEKIGGKLGSPNTKLFKPHYDKVTEGALEREKAVKQLEDYSVKFSMLTETENEIESCSRELEGLQQKLTVFEVLKACFHIYDNKRQWELELKHKFDVKEKSKYENYPSLEKVKALQEEYENLYNLYMDDKNIFGKQVSEERLVYDRMIEESSSIREAWKNISGLKQSILNYKASQAQYYTNKEEILKTMSAVNSSLKGDFIKVLNLDSDGIKLDKLQLTVEKIRILEDEKRITLRELQDNENQRELTATELNGTKAANTGMIFKNYLYTSLGIFLAGTLLLLINKTLGAGLILIGITASFIYFFMRNTAQSSNENRHIDLLSKLRLMDNKIESCNLKICTIDKELAPFANEIKLLKKRLELNDDVSPSGVLNYLKEIQQLKKDIMSLGVLGRKNDKEYEAIKNELLNLSKLLSKINNTAYEIEDPIKASDKLFFELDVKANQLNFAERLRETEVRLKELEGRLKKLLNIEGKDKEIIYEIENVVKDYEVYESFKALNEKIYSAEGQIVHILDTERVANAFTSYGRTIGIEEEDRLKCFEEIFAAYPLKEQIERVYLDTKTNIEEYSKAFEQFKDKRQWIKSELEALSTTEKLEKAQRLIDEGRAGLEALAVKFSTLSAAEYILETIQKEFIGTAKDTLLTGAGDILSKITGGEYKEVLPSENLLESSYKTVLDSGKVNNSESMLSRGTGEQLYLSVRLNRIKGMESKLPIVLDDPFVNFDSKHTKNTLELFCQLGEQNQIFLLTCHAEIIEILMDLRSDIQYWKLEDGNFNATNGDELRKYLSIR